MSKVPDIFGLGAQFPDGKGGGTIGTYITPKDNGQVMWRRMEDQSPKERAKHHAEWERNANRDPFNNKGKRGKG